jgi:RHS repeat-associated protein
MLAIKDARNTVYLTNQYDSNGRVSQQTQADSTTYQFAYTLNQNGKVTQSEVTNPRGSVTRTSFSPSGYPLNTVEALGTPLERSTVITRHSPSNVVATVTDPLNRRADFVYDAHGNLITLTRLAGTPDAVSKNWTYEPTFHQVASATDPLNHTTTFSYDSQGRLTTVTDPLGHQITFTYNSSGQVLTTTNQLNQTVQFGYQRGDLVSTTTARGFATTRFVDAAGRSVRATDSLGRTTHHEFDVLNQLTRIIDALGGETVFTYDPNGNLLTMMNARQKLTSWTYDNMNGATSRTDPLDRQESFIYDASGNLTQWMDRKNQITTYSYDALNRLALIGFGAIGTPPTYASTVAITYDVADRVTSIVDSAAGTISFGYDLLDRLTSETTSNGVVNYTYDAADRQTGVMVAGQSGITYTYDNADRLIEVERAGSSVAITYDEADRRSSLSLPGGIVATYTYDQDSLLTELSYSHGSVTLGNLTYSYDAAGNRTSVGGTFARTALPPVLPLATYDDANQIATWNGTTFNYDSNGNLTTDGSRTFTWNVRNELSSVSGPINATFAYDAVGRRRSKTTGGSSTAFLYQGNNLIQELAGGTPLVNLLAGPNHDEYFTRTDPGGTRNFLTDALATTIALGDSAGSIHTEYTYEPFGTTITNGSSTTNRLGFTGRESDEAGLIFLRARYYDSRLQRFISEDAFDFLGGDTNLHTYAANNPVGLTDPTGNAIPFGKSTTGPCADPPPTSPPKEPPWWHRAIRGLGFCEPQLPGIGPLEGVGSGASRAAGPAVKAIASSAGRGLSAAALAAKAAAARARAAGRRALEKRTGISPADLDAHHHLVVKHLQFFESKGLNISHPDFMSWVERTYHQKVSASITRAWDDWIAKNGPTATPQEILEFAKQVAKDHSISWPR